MLDIYAVWSARWFIKPGVREFVREVLLILKKKNFPNIPNTRCSTNPKYQGYTFLTINYIDTAKSVHKFLTQRSDIDSDNTVHKIPNAKAVEP